MGDYLDAVGEGIAKLLADRADLRVDVVGDDDRVPAALRRHRQRFGDSSPPEPETLAGWALHVWTPRIVGGELVDDLGKLIEASFAGVPSVLPLPARRAWTVSPRTTSWSPDTRNPKDGPTALSRLLGDDGPPGTRRARGSPVVARGARSARMPGEREPVCSVGRVPGRIVSAAPVTIIVPVYRGVDDLHALPRERRAARGSDRARLRAARDRRRLAGAGGAHVASTSSPRRDLPFPVTVLRNPENLGFVGTVNRGLRRATGDVVILNADTAVTDGLARPARGRGRTQFPTSRPSRR